MLDASRVINGSYGQIFHEGNWLTNVQEFEAKVEIQKNEINPAGTRWTKHKVVGLKGSGSMTGFKVTTEMIQLISQVADDRQGAFVTELIGKLDDPEAYGAMRVRLKGVQFDSIDLMNFQQKTEVKEELPFTFEGFEFLDTISE